MKQVAVAATLCLAAAFPMSAWAGASCKANPKADWMSEADAKTKLEA
jgi:hypothetical protein